MRTIFLLGLLFIQFRGSKVRRGKAYTDVSEVHRGKAYTKVSEVYRGKAYKAIDWLQPNLNLISEKTKGDFFLAVRVSVIPPGCTTWSKAPRVKSFW